VNESLDRLTDQTNYSCSTQGGPKMAHIVLYALT